MRVLCAREWTILHASCRNADVRLAAALRREQIAGKLQTSGPNCRLFVSPRSSPLYAVPTSPALARSNPLFCKGRSLTHIQNTRHKVKLSRQIGPPLCSSGQSSWLQIRRPGFDSRDYQTKKVVGRKRGPLSLVSTTEDLLDRKVAANMEICPSI
jgi:hypothetical protein